MEREGQFHFGDVASLSFASARRRRLASVASRFRQTATCAGSTGAESQLKYARANIACVVRRRGARVTGARREPLLGLLRSGAPHPARLSPPKADWGAKGDGCKRTPESLERGPDRVSPFSLLAVIPNTGAAWLSIQLGTRGPLSAHRLRSLADGDRRRVGFANSGGLVFVDESAEQIAAANVGRRCQRRRVAPVRREQLESAVWPVLVVGA